MKTSSLLLGLALVGGLFATSGFASVEDYRQHYQVTRTDIPLPVTVVNPTDLPGRYQGATVMVSMTIDERGQPQDVSVVKPLDPELTRPLVAAISQWRFTPAQKDGQPVAKRIVLPIELTARPS